MDKTKQFVILECYEPYYTVDARNYTPAYEEVSKHTFCTKIRLDCIARTDNPQFFYATPKPRDLKEFKPTKDEYKAFAYQRVVVTCPTSLGMNGFRDSLYITSRCIDKLKTILDEAFGTVIGFEDQGA